MAEGAVLISFRYHLVTIVAVFLALGLGLLVGTTVIDQNLVNGLRGQIASSNRRVAAVKVTLDGLQTDLQGQQAFAQAAAAALVRDRLMNDQVVVVTDDGTSAKTVSGVVSDLRSASANVVAVISLTKNAGNQDAETRAALANILGLPASSTVESLDMAMASQLAARLWDGLHGPSDVLFRLLDAPTPFLETDLKRTGDTLPEVGGSGQTIVVVSGGSGVQTVEPTAFLVPLTEALMRYGARTAAVEPEDSSDAFVTVLRDSGTANGKQMLTVDDVDQAYGQVALVMGLQDLIQKGSGGNYGNKAGVGDPPYPPLGP